MATTSNYQRVRMTTISPCVNHYNLDKYIFLLILNSMKVYDLNAEPYFSVTPDSDYLTGEVLNPYL